MESLVQSSREQSKVDALTMPVVRDAPFIREEALGDLKAGVIAMATIGLCSFFATISLLCFLTYRFIFWKRYYRHPLAENQYVMLIYNLLLADLFQSIAFMASFHWIKQGKVTYGTATCVLQGWWIQTADPGSGLWVLAIAIHTAAVVLRGRQLEYRSFVYCIIALWTFILILGFIPVGIHTNKTFVISESGWCWLSADYIGLRIWAHYFWIFVAEFGNFVLYGIMFFYLRHRTKQATALRQNKDKLSQLNRVVIYMVIYPFVYLVLSLPLAIGRMMSVSEKYPSKTYFAIAGSLMALSGCVDVIVYTLTRRRLVLEADVDTSDRGYHDGYRSNYQTQITSSTGRKKLKVPTRFRQTRMDSKLGTVDEDDDGQASTDDIVRKGNWEMKDMSHGVYQETTIEVTHEPASPSDDSPS